MAGEKNFNIKNGLSVGGVEVIDSSGSITGAAIGSETIDDRVASLLTAGAGIGLSYDDSANTLTITGNVGDITGVNAGAGLTGTATSGDATLNIGAGTGITVNADDIAIDLKDEDDMSSNSASHAASQQSIKAYVDASILTKDNTDEITEGSSNLYFTDARADARITNALVDEDNMASNSATKLPSQQSVKAYVDSQVAGKDNTDEITEGSNLYFTDARARAALSASGDISYNSSTGVISFTNDAGDIESVVAGTGLTGGGTSGAVTVNLDLKDEDDMTSNSASHAASQQSVKAYVDSQVAGKDNTDEITEGSTNLYHTSARVDARITNALIDEDNMVSDSATKLPSQQSVKAYVDAQVATKDNSDEITEGSNNLYHTAARARSAISVSGDLSYNSTSGVISFTNDAGDIESVVAGTGLTGGGTSGDVTLNVNVDDSSLEIDTDTVQVKASGITNAMLAGSINQSKLAGSIANNKLANSTITVNGSSTALGSSVTLDTGDISENGNLYHTSERVDDRVNALLVGGTNITTSYDDTAGTLTINTSGKTEEEIEDIVNGLVVGGTNITSTYDDTAGTLTLAGLSDGSIRGLLSAGGDLSYNSGTGAFSFTERTDAEVRGLISVTDNAGDGSLSYNSSTGAITYSGISDSQVRGKLSVTDSGGDGSLAYNSGTGVITYTGPSAAETRAHLSAGTGVGFSGGAISIGQAVSTTSDVQFADLTLSGDLTVNGTTTTVNTATLNVSDNIITLNNDVTGTPSQDSGIEVERGTSANVSLTWDESEDEWTFGSHNVKASSFEGSLTGNASTASSAAKLTTARTIALGGDLSGSASFDGTGNITISAAVADDSHNHTIANVDGLQTALNTKYESGSNATLGTITTSNTSNSGGYVRNIYQSTSSPTGSDGAVGDLWVLYS
jgi:predicted DNA-binding WGR domain protein